MKDKCQYEPSDRCIDCRKCIVLKYVRFEYTDFVFFPIHVPHITIKKTDCTPISAGFVNLSKMCVFGYSEGLKLKPKKNDIDLIKLLLNRV